MFRTSEPNGLKFKLFQSDVSLARRVETSTSMCFITSGGCIMDETLKPLESNDKVSLLQIQTSSKRTLRSLFSSIDFVRFWWWWLFLVTLKKGEGFHVTHNWNAMRRLLRLWIDGWGLNTTYYAWRIKRYWESFKNRRINKEKIDRKSWSSEKAI